MKKNHKINSKFLHISLKFTQCSLINLNKWVTDNILLKHSGAVKFFFSSSTANTYSSTKQFELNCEALKCFSLNILQLTRLSQHLILI